jgi:uncharacterized repeat protein (TIGR01451 family)
MSSAVNLINSAHINPGDRVCIAMGSCSITYGPNFQGPGCAWSLIFESDNPGESGYGQSSYGGGAGSATNRQYAPAFGHSGGFGVLNDTLGDVDAHSIVPMEGWATRIDVACEVAPGVGKQRRFILSLNNVFQDGTAGTVNTMATISGTNTTAFAEFSCPMHQMDTLAVMEMVEASAPAASLIQGSLRFKAAVDGQFALAGGAANPAQSVDGIIDHAGLGWGYGWAQSTAIAPVPPFADPRWPISESDMSLPGPAADTFQIEALYINIGTVIPVGRYHFITRRNLADTVAQVFATGGALVFRSLGLAGPFAAPTDRLDLRSTAENFPNAGHVSWTWLVVGGGSLITTVKTPNVQFVRGQLGTYTITVSNETDTPTSGLVSVTEMPGPGLTLISMVGDGWTIAPFNVATSTIPLPARSSFPPILVTVLVAPDATSPQTNCANDSCVDVVIWDPQPTPIVTDKRWMLNRFDAKPKGGQQA